MKKMTKIVALLAVVASILILSELQWKWTRAIFGPRYGGFALPDSSSLPLHPDLLRMETAHPSIDLQSALKTKDYRFIGVMELGLSIPSIDDLETYKICRDIFGVRVIQGTSDVIRMSRVT